MSLNIPPRQIFGVNKKRQKIHIAYFVRVKMQFFSYQESKGKNKNRRLLRNNVVDPQKLIKILLTFSKCYACRQQVRIGQLTLRTSCIFNIYMTLVYTNQNLYGSKTYTFTAGKNTTTQSFRSLYLHFTRHRRSYTR